MDFSIVNSINLEKIQNEDEVRTSKRILSNSDLDLNFSQVVVNRNTEEIGLHQSNESDNNIHNEDNNNAEDNQNNINNDQNNDNQDNNDNNSHNNSLILNILMNMMNDNEIDENDNDNNNNNNEAKIPNRKLIKELKNNNYIFIKDYCDQIVDENNISYVSWLKKLYIKINFSIDIEKTKNPIICKYKIEIPDFPILKEKIEKKLFFCFNPQCNCIIYMNEPQKKKFHYEIKDLIFSEEINDINDYLKDRCPLCLKYKCKYCHRTSTLLNANCCFRQLINACSDNDFRFCDFHFLFLLVLLNPLTRVFYMACMINFIFFRALTLENKLMQSKEKINTLVESHLSSVFIFGTYQAKFKRIPMFIISLLNILGSICWAIPFYIYIEVILNILMVISFFTRKNLFKMIICCFYLIAFVPGLRKDIIGHLKNI